jgi:hypothetical protein
MGIDLRWEDERGKKLDEVADPRDYLGLALSLSDQKETSCLRFIDPYGDTVFNQWQIPVLIAELQSLRAAITDEHMQAFFEKRNKSRRLANVSSKVIEEIEQRQRRITVKDVIDHIDLILALVQRSQGNIHTYLKFYGD